MSIVTLAIGESGTGKTYSLRNLDPASSLLLSAISKPLPFRSGAWGVFDKDANPHGNIVVTDDPATIIAAMKKTQRKVIVVDDFQYVMANEFMRRSDEGGYQKFTDIGRHAWDILRAAAHLAPDVRVYVLAHSTTDEGGTTKLKTVGRMLDEKISIEGMVTIVLRAVVAGDDYRFATRNSGSDTVKTPFGMFEDAAIDNDLAMVDDAIVAYYGIGAASAAPKPKRAAEAKPALNDVHPAARDRRGPESPNPEPVAAMGDRLPPDDDPSVGAEPAPAPLPKKLPNGRAIHGRT